MLRNRIFPMTFVAAVAACTSTYEMDEVVTTPNVVKVEVSKIADKGKKFQIFTQVTNLHDQATVAHFKEIQCFRGNLQGQIDYPFFGAGKHMLNFAPRQTRTFDWMCKLPHEGTGDFKLSLGPIYENPSGDGVTPGKKLSDATDIVIHPAD